MRKERRVQTLGVRDHFVAADVELEVTSLLVSHYAVNEKMSYEEIQQMTGLSRATVARRLQHAKNAGYLVERPELYVPPQFAAAFQDKIRECKLQHDLLVRLRSYGVRAVTVVPDKQVLPPERHELHIRVGKAAAARISQALSGRTGYIGVNWGHSVRHCVQQLERPAGSSQGLVFVPLMGNLSVDESNEKEYEEVWKCSANRLAGLASNVFPDSTALWLTTPAIIPKVFQPNSSDPDLYEQQERELSVIWTFLEEDASYQKVFGKGHHRAPGTAARGVGVGSESSDDSRRTYGIIRELDTIITGMSALEPESALCAMAKLVNEDELPILHSGGYVGDLSGHPICCANGAQSTPEARRLADAISALVVSATPQDFVRVADKARTLEDERKGVFLIGHGEAKAKAFLAACQMRAINEIITTRGTAVEMINLIDQHV